MGSLLDVLGALMIGAMLMLMMISFQFQLQDTASRAMYTANMVDHMDMAAVKINSVIALAGIGYTPGQTVVTAGTNRLVFNSYWNYNSNQITPTPVTIEIGISNTATSVGKTLTIRQNGELLDDLGYILWVEDIAFKYYTKADAITTTAASVRSAEAWLTFRRDPVRPGTPPLRTRLQVKCFFMNAYMRGA